MESLIESPDFFIAISTESTLLTCPAPTPTVVLSLTISIPFDLTCFNTFHPKSIVFISLSDGLCSVTTCRLSSDKMLVSVSCTITPPTTFLTSNNCSRE